MRIKCQSIENLIESPLSVSPLSANPQNGQTHSNNCLSVFDHFVGLVLKGLKVLIYFSGILINSGTTL